MSQELLYTSAQSGLKPGSHGFCTVVSSAGMARNLAERLESLSGYRHAFPLHSPHADQNPIAFSHVQVKVGGKNFHVLSRIADAGQDYTGRSNKIAHHVALSDSELIPCGPAVILQQPEFCETQWDGQTRTLPAGRVPRMAGRSTGVCQAWQRVAGDAGWAGWVAEKLQQSGGRPVFVLFETGTDTLALADEVLRLLPQKDLWKTTFSTYVTALPAGVDCQLRFVFSDSQEAAGIRRHPHQIVVDLAGTPGRADGGELVTAARTGQLASEEIVEPLPAAQPPAGRPGRRNAGDRQRPVPPPAKPSLPGGPPVVPERQTHAPDLQRHSYAATRPAHGEFQPQEHRPEWPIGKVVVCLLLLMLTVGGAVGFVIYREIEATVGKNQAAAEKAKQERQAAEAKLLAAEQAKAKLQAAKKAKAKLQAATKAEADRQEAAKKAKAKLQAATKAEADRQEAAKMAEAKRQAAEKAEADRQAARKAEAERLAGEKAKQERALAGREYVKKLIMACETRKEYHKVGLLPLPDNNREPSKPYECPRPAKIVVLGSRSLINKEKQGDLEKKQIVVKQQDDKKNQWVVELDGGGGAKPIGKFTWNEQNHGLTFKWSSEVTPAKEAMNLCPMRLSFGGSSIPPQIVNLFPVQIGEFELTKRHKAKQQLGELLFELPVVSRLNTRIEKFASIPQERQRQLKLKHRFYLPGLPAFDAGEDIAAIEKLSGIQASVGWRFLKSSGVDYQLQSVCWTGDAEENWMLAGQAKRSLLRLRFKRECALTAKRLNDQAVKLLRRVGNVQQTQQNIQKYTDMRGAELDSLTELVNTTNQGVSKSASLKVPQFPTLMPLGPPAINNWPAAQQEYAKGVMGLQKVLSNIRQSNDNARKELYQNKQKNDLKFLDDTYSPGDLGSAEDQANHERLTKLRKAISAYAEKYASYENDQAIILTYVELDLSGTPDGPKGHMLPLAVTSLVK